MLQRTTVACSLVFPIVLTLLTGPLAAQNDPNPTTATPQDRDAIGRLLDQARELDQAGQADAAREKVEQLLALQRQALGKSHLDVADTLAWLSSLQAARLQFETARESLEEAIRIRTERLGATHWRTGDTRGSLRDLERMARLTPEDLERLEKAAELESRCQQRIRQGQLGQILELRSQSLALYEQVWKEAHRDIAAAQNQLGYTFWIMGRETEAIEHYKQSIQILERIYHREEFPQGHPNLATALNNLALSLEKIQDFSQAQETAERCLRMFESLHPADEFPRGVMPLAGTYANLGNLQRTRREFDAARANLTKAAVMMEQLAAQGEALPQHVGFVKGLMSLLHADLSEYPEAVEQAEQATAIWREATPNGSRELATMLNNLGSLHSHLGRLDQAATCYREAIDMLRALGLLPRDIASALENLADVLQRQGNFAAARDHLDQSRALREEQFPEGSPERVRSDVSRASLLLETGELNEARGHLEAALRTYEQLAAGGGGRPDMFEPDRVQVLNNLGTLLIEQGEYDQAGTVLTEALDVRVRLFPDTQFPLGHPDLAQALHNLGTALTQQARQTTDSRQSADLFQKAESCLRRALDMNQRLYPDALLPHGHPDLVQAYNALGSLYWERQDWEQAVAVSRQAVEAAERYYHVNRFPQGHTHLAAAVNNLGTVLASHGQYEEASRFSRRAIDLFGQLYPKEQFPDGTEQLARAFHNLGYSEFAAGNEDAARQHFGQALEMFLEQASTFYIATSEAEATSFARHLPATLDALLTVSERLNADNREIYQLVWRAKGATRRVMWRRRLELLRMSSAPVQTLWRELRDARRELAQAASSPQGLDHDIHQRRIATKEQLERRLAEQLPELRRAQTLATRRPEDLAGRMPQGSVFIDLLHYIESVPDTANPRQWVSTRRYVAFVTRPGQTVTRVEFPATAEEIEQAVALWLEQIARSDRQPSGATAFRQLVWEPLTAVLPKETRILFISPDGIFVAAPWAAVPQQNGRYLLEDFACALSPNGLILLDELTKLPSTRQDPHTILTVGGVNHEPAVAGASLASTNRDDARSAEGISALPGTQREVDTIAEVARQIRPVPHVMQLSDKQATAERVVELLVTAHMAHLATHGFVELWPVRLEADPRMLATRNLQVASNDLLRQRNPLLRSGLLLAAGEADTPREASPQTAEDSRQLRAEAIAGLSLDQLDLAVLSACHSGAGEIRAGEGVFSLQTAFAQAGTRSVIASLWEADDLVSQQLMLEFYRNLWVKRMGKLESLRQAQLTILRQGTGASHLPRFWAGWTLSGEPGELAAMHPAPASTAAPESSDRRWLWSRHLPNLAMAVGIGLLVLVVARLARR